MILLQVERLVADRQRVAGIDVDLDRVPVVERVQNMLVANDAHARFGQIEGHSVHTGRMLGAVKIDRRLSRSAGAERPIALQAAPEIGPVLLAVAPVRRVSVVGGVRLVVISRRVVIAASGGAAERQTQHKGEPELCPRRLATGTRSATRMLRPLDSFSSCVTRPPPWSFLNRQ